jgi:hypothetical protein
VHADAEFSTSFFKPRYQTVDDAYRAGLEIMFALGVSFYINKLTVSLCQMGPWRFLADSEKLLDTLSVLMYIGNMLLWYSLETEGRRIASVVDETITRDFSKPGGAHPPPPISYSPPLSSLSLTPSSLPPSLLPLLPSLFRAPSFHPLLYGTPTPHYPTHL